MREGGRRGRGPGVVNSSGLVPAGASLDASACGPPEGEGRSREGGRWGRVRGAERDMEAAKSPESALDTCALARMLLSLLPALLLLLLPALLLLLLHALLLSLLPALLLLLLLLLSA